MITVTKVLPSLPLRDFVRYFQFREAATRGETIRYPIAARPEQFIEFYFRDPYEVVAFRSGKQASVPPVVVNGPQTQRGNDLLLNGTFEVFTIHFQPTGFFRLFHIPVQTLTDRALSAPEVMGSDICTLHEQLRAAGNIGTRVQRAEAFLMQRVPQARPFHPVQPAASALLRQKGAVDLGSLVQASRLSTRRFERKFEEQVGVTPKLYSRIIRVDHALHMKCLHPQRSWAEVTYEAGYYDQMHLIKEFKLLSGETPSKFFCQLSLAQEWVLFDKSFQEDA